MDATDLVKRTDTFYISWPLWAQVLLPVGLLTMWVPIYFVVALFKETSCIKKRRQIKADVEHQNAATVPSANFSRPRPK